MSTALFCFPPLCIAYSHPTLYMPVKFPKNLYLSLPNWYLVESVAFDVLVKCNYFWSVVIFDRKNAEIDLLSPHDKRDLYSIVDERYLWVRVIKNQAFKRCKNDYRDRFLEGVIIGLSCELCLAEKCPCDRIRNRVPGHFVSHAISVDSSFSQSISTRIKLPVR